MSRRSDRVIYPSRTRLVKWLVRFVVAELVVIVLAVAVYQMFDGSAALQAGRSSADALMARVKGEDECIHQSIPVVGEEAPSVELYRSPSLSVDAEHDWIVHHMHANCVIIEAPLPYVPDQLLIVHDDPLIYDWGQWDTFYYRPSEKGDHIVTITASGPGGTTVLEGPIDSLLADGGS